MRRFSRIALGARFWAAAFIAAVMAAVPSPAVAQVLGRGETLAVPTANIVLSLLACLALAVLAAWLHARLKRNLSPAGVWPIKAFDRRRRLSVLETQRLGATAELCLFESEGEEFLVIVSPSQSTVVRQRSARAAATLGETSATS